MILESYLLSLKINYLIWKCERLHKKWLKSQNAIEPVANERKPKNFLANSLLEIRPMSIDKLQELTKKENSK